MTAVSEQIGNWVGEFSKQPAAAPWLQEIREAAFRRFAELGFPTTHDEEWRFTNVAPIARTPFSVAAPKVTLRAAPAVEVLGAGRLQSRDREGAAPFPTPFAALNTAFLHEVTVLQVPRGAVVDEPIEILYEVPESADPVAVHPRTLILIGANAQCTIVETHKGQGRYLTNAFTEIVAGEGSVVDHYKLTLEAPAAFHVGATQAQIGRSANFSSHSITLGGALVRHDAGAVLSEGTEATLNGLYVVNGSQHVDNHTVIDHARPHAASHELYKGILDGRATAVFNGRIIVRKDAQKTDSKQTNKNLVLSDDSVINTKPELQILADDVRCTHGATIGQLDAESMFYLQSRGIGREQARSLLTYAFAQDIIDRVKVQALRDSLERALFEKFHERPY
jgi:Fe-S cluster assembly protein SufD